MGFGSFKITFKSGFDWIISWYFPRKCVKFHKVIFNQSMSLLNVMSSYGPVAAFVSPTVAFILQSFGVIKDMPYFIILAIFYEFQLTNF